MTPKEKAAGLTAAQDKELQSKAYPSAKSLSTLKIIVGGLLLFGDRKPKVFWPFFEAMLRQYVGLRVSSEKASQGPGATNLHRPE